ncbi:MAG TPA: hypothetical protein VF746_21905 [Longimicrobium sp.]|jgi:hypothetical protein
MNGEAGGRRPPLRLVLAAAGALLTAGALTLYVRRALSARSHASSVKPPTAGRPLALVRGELAAAGAAGEE